MMSFKRVACTCALLSLSSVWQQNMLAQTAEDAGTALLSRLTPVTDAMLRNPPAEDWLIWRRTNDTYGFSPLNQINRDNVAKLTQAWRLPLEAGSSTPTPLVHDGVLFLLSVNDTLLAMDASNGKELWTYKHKSEGSTASSKIGIALYQDLVLMPTNDLHIVALNSRTGEVVWDHAIADVSNGRRPHSLRSAPMIANGKLIQGVTATMVPEGGFIVALDLETGEESWRFYTVARPDGPGGNTWNGIPLSARSGGSVWMPGSYDPELDLVYFGTAPTYDTAPLLLPVNEPGVNNDALYTNVTLALRPATGELVWHYQHIANDQWDLDWVYERQLINVPVNGVMRKAVITAGKMALFDALDAASGEYLFSLDMGLQNLIKEIDPVTGRKIMNPNATPNAEDMNLVCPFAAGGRNWQSSSYNPTSKILFLPIIEMCMNGGPTGVGSILSTGAPMEPTPLPGSDGKFGRLQAVSFETRELLWDFREMAPPTTAIVATAGGLIFGGALDNTFKAIDDTTGKVLWQTDTGDVPASFPITYAADGKQYVAVVVGQPTIHAGVFKGAMFELTGGAEGPIGRLQSSGAALIVYALE